MMENLLYRAWNKPLRDSGGGLKESDDSDEIPRKPKDSQRKPPRGNENAGNRNVGNANAGNGNANEHASGSSSSNSNGYNGLGGKPPTVIGVRYFACYYFLLFGFFIIYSEFSFRRTSRPGIRLLFVVGSTFRFVF